MSAAIELRGLRKAYRHIDAVSDLSLTVGWGRVTGFLGPNGAGKTTTLRCLLGLARPTSGEALVAGRPYRHLGNPPRTVGSLLGPDQFHPRRRARAHLRTVAAAIGVPDERVEQVLDAVELDRAAHRRVGEYSLGMRQRLGLASALLGDPRILVLDEPANGLDPAGMRWLRSTLRAFADTGGAVFVSSHQLRELATVADEVVVIHHGRLVTHQPLDQLLATSPGGDLEDVFLALTEEQT